MGNCTYVGVVRVSGEIKDKGWVITSENLPGLFLAGNDLEKLTADIPANIEMLYQLNYGMSVKVCVAGEPGIQKPPKLVPPIWGAVQTQNQRDKAEAEIAKRGGTDEWAEILED